MKKIFFVFAIIAMAFTSCNPLEDIYEEIDNSTAKDGIVGDVTYTITKEDYSKEKKEGGFFEFATPNFASLDDAKTKLPAFLTDKYPALGVIWENGKIKEASSANITFAFSDPISTDSYTVTDADYTAIGLTTLVSNRDFNKFFDYKFPNTKKGSIVNLTYKTLAPKIDYTLVDADYALVGNGRFNNFDIRAGKPDETEEARRAKMQTILLTNFPNAPVGQQYLIEYAIYDGAPGTRTMLVQLNAAGNYDLINGYTLTNADYALVGNGRFNNFDIRAGKPDETEEARRVKIQTILLNNFPSASTGDQYFITYAIYNGASGTRTMLLKFNGTGYDLIGATVISKTSKFTFTKDWNPPFVLALADYQAMGQQFENFSGRNDAQKEEAARKVSVFLATKYPYAAVDDFVAVQYNLYVGGGTTIATDSNFIYDGTKWNYIPTVISTSLKFGHNGTTWVPDNTIKYTLTNADYNLVGNGRYNNFDVRPGKDEEKESARLAKINTILLNNFPSDAEGQKYVVSYKIYNGANGIWTMAVIKTGGAYVLQ